MVLPKIGFNEGSLFRRTILHVGTFLLGSVVFIGLVSFVLVAIAKGLVDQPRAVGEAPGDEADVAAGSRPAKAPLVKAPGRGKRAATPALAGKDAKDE